MKMISLLASKQQEQITEKHWHNGKVSNISCSTEHNKEWPKSDNYQWSYTNSIFTIYFIYYFDYSIQL